MIMNGLERLRRSLLSKYALMDFFKAHLQLSVLSSLCEKNKSVHAQNSCTEPDQDHLLVLFCSIHVTQKRRNSLEEEPRVMTHSE